MMILIIRIVKTEIYAKRLYPIKTIQTSEIGCLVFKQQFNQKVIWLIERY